MTDGLAAATGFRRLVRAARIAACATLIAAAALSPLSRPAHAAGLPPQKPLPLPDANPWSIYIITNYVEAIREATEQITWVMLQQMPIIGSFLDAKEMLETERMFGETNAQAHRDYQPGEQVCGFGTIVRATADSKYKVDQNTAFISLMMNQRDRLNASAASRFGPFTDTEARLDKFKKVYCDPNDDNGELGKTITGGTAVCQPGTAAGTDGPQRKNKDVSYRDVIDHPLTLNLNFMVAGMPTPDEQDIIALGRNLYNDTVLTAIQAKTMEPPVSNFVGLMDMRQLAAVHSVENFSYASIAAQKTAGTGLNAQYLNQVMLNLGVPAADVTALIGANPSYFAQMEILTKKVFQDPQFIVNLYESPANVARMGVALRVIKLMHDRDRFEQQLRKEALLAQLLELKLKAPERAYASHMNAITGSAKQGH